MMSSSFLKIEKYHRDVGALCSGIPALIYIFMMIAYSNVNIYNIMWLIITFTPLIISGGYLDIVSNSIIFKHISRWWMRMIFSWIILFPLSRGLSLSIISYFFNEELNLNNFLMMLGSSAIFGILYGFFFISAYLYLLRIFKRLERNE